MDQEKLWVFQNEVNWQCRMATVASGDIEAALADHNAERLFYSIQAFLSAAANISKLFWPQATGPFPERAEELRKSLGIKDDSVLKCRKMRNHLEHFDERLEQSLSWGIGFVDVSFGCEGGFSVPDERMYLRFFNTTKFAVNFRGTIFELRPIYQAIQELSKKAKAAAENRWG